MTSIKYNSNWQIYLTGLLLLVGVSCNPQQKPSTPGETERSSTIVTPQAVPFHPVTYRLTQLDTTALVDKLRTLPRADSSLIRLITPRGKWERDFEEQTAYYRYRTLALGPNRAEVVAVISDFNGLSGTLQLVLFSSDNRWLSNMMLASYSDGPGATEECTSIQESPTTFRQHKVIREVLGEAPEYAGMSTTTIHYQLRFDQNHFTRTQQDSTYQVLPIE